MGGKSRRGKIVTAGHSQRIEGLAKLLAELEEWDEIETIRTGPISGSRSPKSNRVPSKVRQKEYAIGSGGGFHFHVTRWAKVGTIITGIKCAAVNGTYSQEVYLTSKDYPALRARLAKEGYLKD